MHRSGPIKVFLGHCCVFLLVAADVEGAGRQISLSIPEGFPTDLSVVVVGHLQGESAAGETIRLRPAEFSDRPLIGQIGSDGKQVWIPMRVPKKLVGTDLRIQGELTDGDRAIRVEDTDEGFQFWDGDSKRLFYQRAPVTQHKHTRAGYVHPLRGMDGEVFTEVFPQDHRHHQGVFWAWHQLWVADRKIGDPWVAKDHLVVVKEANVLDQGPVFGTLEVRAHWTSPLLVDDSGEPQPIVEERTRVRLFRTHGGSAYVDFTIRLTPLLPEIKIGGSENVKGYSGFTVRVKPPPAMQLHDASGLLSADNVQTPSSWADVSGEFADGQTSGVGILSHPSLAKFPPHWLLRHYGMQNVAYPGREPITLSADKPLVIRHRLVVHRGSAQQARIADHQRVYELTP